LICSREAEYPIQKEMLVALWERIVEDCPEASDALEIKRQVVKIKYTEPN